MAAVSFKPNYCIEDYLLWEGDWELWDGIPVAMSPAPSFFHQAVAGNLFFQLKKALHSEPCSDACVAVYESDWHVDANTVVRPDLMVVCEKPSASWLEKRPEDRSALLLSLDPDGTYRELPPEDPFEIHPGCVLQLEVAPLFV